MKNLKGQFCRQKSSPMTLIRQTKDNLTVKGWIGGFAALLSVSSYIVYYIFYYEGIKLDELYFIATGVSISIFTGLLFTFFHNKCAKTFLLFASVFYAIMIVVYVIHWIITGLPYAYIKLSLIAGFFVGLIYLAHDTYPTNANAKD